LTGDTIAGQFREGDAIGTFSIRRVDAKPPTFKQEEVSFRNGDVTLSGTLLLPLTEVPYPAVVFLHGAGSEGRYGARFLAEYFTRYGIAALIYDKRGVGKSTGDWKRSDFADLAGDAIAGIHFLQQRKEINPRKIGIYGHSQGGSIGPLVAARSRDVAFVISAAGGGVPMYEAEINSLTNQIRAKGMTGGDLAEATAFIQTFVSVARTGEDGRNWTRLSRKRETQNGFPYLGCRPKTIISGHFTGVSPITIRPSIGRR